MQLDQLSKESDIFKIKFEKIIPIIKNQLKLQYIWAVEEIAFKKILNIDYDTSVTYEKMRYILKNSDLRIKIRKNKIINGKCTNIFEFYIENDIKKMRKKSDEINKNIVESNDITKERLRNVVKESITETENKNKDIIDNIPTYVPLPYICICFGCRKKVILKYPELNCPECNFLILSSWD